MNAKIRGWFEPPAGIEDEEQSRQAVVLNGVAWAALGITLVLGPALWWVGAPPLVLALLLPLALAEILVLILLRRSKVRAASRLLVLVALLTTLLPAFFQGGLSSTYLYYSLVIVVLAGLLLGARYVNLITAVFMVAATFMLLAADTPLLPELISPPTPLRRWVTVIASLFMVRTLFLMAINGLQAALERARQNEQRLQESNRALEETRLALEQRVAERTAALEQRARQLQASAEVVSAINSAMSTAGGSTPDLNHLLTEITHLISERFDLYAVNIYLAEASASGAEAGDGSLPGGMDAAERLVLRAANTQSGRQLIEKGYSLSLSQPSIVASAARTRMPRLAADVRQDEQYLENAEFPYTRSEAALPLVTGGRLLGVLDVQSSQPAPLSQEDLSALQTLANQVAIAIENAQLFAANQRTLESLQRAYGNLSREAWQKLLRAQPERGYRAGAVGDPTPVSGEWRPEMLQAREHAQVVIGPASAEAHTLAVPIKIRDQVMGVVRLTKSPQAGEWRRDEVALVETLSDRLSAALESARLFEETRRTAERERLTGEITAQMRSINDPQQILQIAARELRKALNADKAQLVVQTAIIPPSSAAPADAKDPAGDQP